MPLNPDAVGTETEAREARWTSKDSLLYALGVGAGVSDPTGFELSYVAEYAGKSDGRGTYCFFNKQPTIHQPSFSDCV